jgi:surface protein
VQSEQDKSSPPKKSAVRKTKAVPATPKTERRILATDATIRDIVQQEIERLGNDADLNHIDVSEVTDMSELFAYCPFNGDISRWNTSNVTKMYSMFSGTTAFNQPIGNWDVSNVTDMAHMFWDAKAFNNNVYDWDVSSVTDMSGMFAGTRRFNQPIDRWDVGNVENMGRMFEAASAFNQYIDEWDVSKVQCMERMFKRAKKFNQPLGQWDVSNVTDMKEMFRESIFNQDISGWDVSQVRDFSFMFFDSRFWGNISAWNVQVENPEQQCEKMLSDSPHGDLFDLLTSLDGCVKVTHPQVRHRMAKGMTMEEAIRMLEAKEASKAPRSTQSTQSIKATNDTIKDIVRQEIQRLGNDADLNHIDVSRVTDMRFVFDHIPFNGDVSKWDVRWVTHAKGMFAFTRFQGDLSSWELDEDMDYDERCDNMFEHSPYETLFNEAPSLKVFLKATHPKVRELMGKGVSMQDAVRVLDAPKDTESLDLPDGAFDD